MEPIILAGKNPYVGPRTFEEGEEELHFGRNREALELLALVVGERLTLFYAQSGAGKSSLLNARLVPSLRKEGFAVLPLARVSGEVPDGIDADKVQNIFVYNLLLSLNQEQPESERLAAEQLVATTLEQYFAGKTGAADEEPLVPLDEIVEVRQPALIPHILLIDQFEEIITNHPDQWQKRASFFEQLNAAMRRHTNLWVLLTLREDHIAAIEPYAHFIHGRLRVRYYMQRMGESAALEAIENPATLGGREFAVGVAKMLVDNLRRIRVQDETQVQLGQFIEPVQLQVVCHQLWENLSTTPLGPITEEHLQKAGDVDKALGEFYERAIYKVLQNNEIKTILQDKQSSISERQLRHWFDKKLITEVSTRGLVFQGKSETDTIPNEVVGDLVKQFLLRAETRPGGIWIELVHDRFIEPIQKADRSWLQGQSPLLRTAQAWSDAKRDSALLYLGQELQDAEGILLNGETDPLIIEFVEESRKSAEVLRGGIWQVEPLFHPTDSGFERSLALIIGIDSYSNGIPPLHTAINDARRLAQILRTQHGYHVHEMTESVTKSQLDELFAYTLPEKVNHNDHLLIYFAGRGVALTDENGLGGFLFPQDANIESRVTFLPLAEVERWLQALRCRHLLVVFDCNFYREMPWSQERIPKELPDPLYCDHYDRFLQGRTFQMVLSLAGEVEVPDIWAGHGLGQRIEQEEFSTFAQALCDGLLGKADLLPQPSGDGLITLTELYTYIQQAISLEDTGESIYLTPPRVSPTDKSYPGEYLLHAPGKTVDIKPAPPLTVEKIPYRGLKPYEEGDAELFFGRTNVIHELARWVEERQLTIVLGASGAGKSSLVKAGLVPYLRKKANASSNTEPSFKWHILPPIRPTDAPIRVLYDLVTKEFGDNGIEGALNPKTEIEVRAQFIITVLTDWHYANPTLALLLVVDQLEELVTICRNDRERDLFIEVIDRLLNLFPERLHIVLTLRSDFEPQFAKSSLAGVLRSRWEPGRYFVPPMNQDDLREVIERPAAAATLFFEDSSMLDELINEVMYTPGALSMLSFTLSELCQLLIKRQDNTPLSEAFERTLTRSDYRQLGGVVGSLSKRADMLYEELDPPHQATMQRIMLRMIAVEGNELARRRVPIKELDFVSAEENSRVEKVINQLVESQLIVQGSDDADIEYVEPAHDALVRAWERLLVWKREAEETISLQRHLSLAASEWARAPMEAKSGLLWTNDPRLPQFQSSLPKDSRWDNFFQRTTQLFWPSARISDQITWLNRLETEFVKKSLLQHAALQRQFVAVTSAVIIVLALLSAYALSRQQIAQAEAQRAEASAESAIQAEATAVAEKNRANQALEDASQARNAAFQAQNVAINEAAIARSRELANQAIAMKADDQVQSLLLAIEAITATWNIANGADTISVVAAEQSLRDLLTSANGVPLVGHTDRITRLAYTPNGETLVTASDDGTIRLWNVGEPNAEPEILRGNRSISALSISPNGRGVARGTIDGLLVLSDIQKDQTQVEYELAGTVRDIGFSPDERWLAAASDNGTIHLWDLTEDSSEPILLVDLSEQKFGISEIAFSPDGDYLVAASTSQQIRSKENAPLMLWRTDELPTEPQFLGQGEVIIEGGVLGFAFSPDERFLAASADFGNAYVWDMSNLDNEPFMLVYEFENSGAIAFARKGNILAIGTVSGSILLWEPSTGQQLSKLFQPAPEPVISLTISSEGDYLVSHGTGNTARIWNMKDINVPPVVLQGHQAPLSDLAFSPDGAWLATASDDGTARIWNVNNPTTEPLVRTAHKSAVTSAVFSPDSTLLASGGSDGHLLLWRVASIYSPKELLALPGSVTNLLFSPDQQWLAASTLEQLRLWNLADTTTAPINPPGPSQAIHTLAFSPDGKWLASASTDNTIYLWSVEDWNVPRFVMQGYPGYVKTMAFSDDSRWLAISGLDKKVLLWNMEESQNEAVEVPGEMGEVIFADFAHNTGQLITVDTDGVVRTLEIDGAQSIPASEVCEIDVPRIVSAKLGPQGQWLAIAGNDFSVRLCNIQKAQVADRILRGHEDRILAMAFTPDEHWLITASADGKILLWDLSSSTIEAIVLSGTTGAVRTLSVSANGDWLVATGGDANLRQWHLDSNDLIEVACDIAARNFTLASWEQFFPGLPYRQTCPEWPIHPSVAQLYLERGRALARQGSEEDAVTEFERALVIDGSLQLDPESEARRIREQATQAEIVDPSLKVGINSLTPIDPSSGRIMPVVADPGIIADTGAGWVSINFTLGDRWLSPTDDTRVDGLNWEENYRSIINGYRSQGLKIYANIGVEAVAEDPGDRFRDAPPLDGADSAWIDAYVAAYVAILKMFENDLLVVESLNEPDDWHGGQRSWFHPGWYAIIQERLYRAVKNESSLSSIVLVSGPLQGLYNNGNASAVYLQNVYEGGIARFGWGQGGNPFPFDGVGYHLYLNESASISDSQLIDTYFAFTTQMREVTLRAEGRVKPLYISEIGWTSQDGEQLQADRLRSALSLIRYDPAVEIGLWFAIQDLPNLPYGLYRAGELSAANRKLSYDAFKAVMAGELAPEVAVALCLARALTGEAEYFARICSIAINASENDMALHDRRAIVRALTGDLHGAIEDFDIVVQLAREIDASMDFISQREAWISDLLMGQNPFDEATLENLRND